MPEAVAEEEGAKPPTKENWYVRKTKGENPTHEGLPDRAATAAGDAKLQGWEGRWSRFGVRHVSSFRVCGRVTGKAGWVTNRTR